MPGLYHSNDSLLTCLIWILIDYYFKEINPFGNLSGTKSQRIGNIITEEAVLEIHIESKSGAFGW